MIFKTFEYDYSEIIIFFAFDFELLVFISLVFDPH